SRGFGVMTMLPVKFRKLSKAWQKLKLSSSRMKAKSSWLRWEDSSEEKDGEANASTLQYNCAIVHCMVECLQQLDLISIDKISLCVEDFYSNMSWDIGSGRIYKDAWGLRKLYPYALRRELDCFKRQQTPSALFKLIRHLRESLPPPDRKLKGICKTIAEKKKAEAEAGEEEHECQDEGEQGEEEEPDDDECLDVKEIKAGKDAGGSPVRRLPKKTATSAEDVLYLGTAKSQEQRELDDIMEKIRLLEIARSDETQPVDIRLVESPPSTSERDPDLPMVDPLMQKQLRSKKKDSLAPGKPKKNPKPKANDEGSSASPTMAMKVSGKAKGKQPAERSTGADAASSKKDLRNRKQGCPAVVVPQCAEHVVVVLQKKESLQMGKIFKGKPKRAPVLTTIFTIVSYLPLDYTEEYEALEMHGGEANVTSTMKKNGISVASITWGPDSLDFMSHGFPCLRNLIMHCSFVSTPEVYAVLHAEAEAWKHCTCKIHWGGSDGRQATHQHWTLCSWVLSKCACQDQTLPEASFGIDAGTGYEADMDGGGPSFPPHPGAPPMGTLDLAGESVSCQLLVSKQRPLKESPAVLELQGNSYLSSHSYGKAIIHCLQEEGATYLHRCTRGYRVYRV
ncbi:unnamed protein product, partial [Symbiodinium necroappetens]